MLCLIQIENVVLVHAQVLCVFGRYESFAILMDPLASRLLSGGADAVVVARVGGWVRFVIQRLYNKVCQRKRCEIGKLVVIMFGVV